VLSVGIAVTGLVTYAYFSLASHTLSASDYSAITVLWSSVFIVVSILYRPVEQLLSRTIADRAARGQRGSAHLKLAAAIQLGLGVVFVVGALALRHPLQDDLLGGSQALYWVLIVAVVSYAASYFARGFLAGHHRFGLYGGLVLMEAISRCLFALAVAIGIAEGQAAVAFGIAAAPIVSLAVVPAALTRRFGSARQDGDPPEDLEPRPAGPVGEAAFSLSHGAGFATAVLIVMACEQALLNAGPLLVKLSADDAASALPGQVFNVLLIARAPLQLFQAVQTAILPHLTKLRASGETDPFRRSVNLTLAAIATFAAGVALATLAVGPTLMSVFFGGDQVYDRLGLTLVAIGMGLYLAAATLNQAALARSLAKQAALCWLVSAGAFVAFLLMPPWDDRLLQVEVAFPAAALLLCALLYSLFRRGEPDNERHS